MFQPFVFHITESGRARACEGERRSQLLANSAYSPGKIGEAAFCGACRRVERLVPQAQVFGSSRPWPSGSRPRRSWSRLVPDLRYRRALASWLLRNSVHASRHPCRLRVGTCVSPCFHASFGRKEPRLKMKSWKCILVLYSTEKNRNK